MSSLQSRDLTSHLSVLVRTLLYLELYSHTFIGLISSSHLWTLTVCHFGGFRLQDVHVYVHFLFNSPNTETTRIYLPLHDASVFAVFFTHKQVAYCTIVFVVTGL